MTPELLKKLDRSKMYSWDEVMDIATTISTKEARDKIIMDVFIGKNDNPTPQNNSRRRKKQTNE